MATFANPEGMKDCFYIPDPYVDLKTVSRPVVMASSVADLVSAPCTTY